MAVGRFSLSFDGKKHSSRCWKPSTIFKHTPVKRSFKRESLPLNLRGRNVMERDCGGIKGRVWYRFTDRSCAVWMFWGFHKFIVVGAVGDLVLTILLCMQLSSPNTRRFKPTVEHVKATSQPSTDVWQTLEIIIESLSNKPFNKCPF